MTMLTCAEYAIAYVTVLILLILPSPSLSLTVSQTFNYKFNQDNDQFLSTRIRAKITPSFDSNDDDIPSMDWLTGSSDDGDTGGIENLADSSPYIEEHSIDEDLGDVPIPTTGVSVADEMVKTQKDRYYTEIVPITGLGNGVTAARMLSSTTAGVYEPVRYLVCLSKKFRNKSDDENDDDTKHRNTHNNGNQKNNIPDEKDSMYEFVLIDVPPFSTKLAQELRTFMGPNGHLSAILVTSRDCMHFEDTAGMFTIRRSDLIKWKKAFSDTATIAYRMDIPRDCKESITQRLDGYGPWAMGERNSTSNAVDNTCLFQESGRPFTMVEWDPEIAQQILAGERKPPGEEEEDEDDDDDNDWNKNENIVIDLDDNLQHPSVSIRANEEGKRIVAVYTPGRTYGSMTYIFPELNLCASGFCIPLEYSRDEENIGIDSAGPSLDHRGYITTSKAGMPRQIESARKLVNTYVDRFDVVLTARGDPFYLDGDVEDRRETLLEVLESYEKLGSIYEQLGIGPNN